MKRSFKKKLLAALREGYEARTWRPEEWSRAWLRRQYSCLRQRHKVQLRFFLASLLSALAALPLWFGNPPGSEYRLLALVFFFIAFAAGPFIWALSGGRYPRELLEVASEVLDLETKKDVRREIKMVFDELVFLYEHGDLNDWIARALSQDLYCDVMLGLNQAIVHQLRRRAGRVFVRQELAKIQGSQGSGIDNLRRHMIDLAENAEKCGLVGMPDKVPFMFENKIVHHSDWNELGASPPAAPVPPAEKAAWFCEI